MIITTTTTTIIIIIIVMIIFIGTYKRTQLKCSTKKKQRLQRNMPLTIVMFDKYKQVLL